MASTVDELTVSYTEDGIETVKELDKVVLTKGAWSTIMYKYVSWDRRNETYGAPAYTIRRYQKRNGEYQMRSKFNITNAEQATKIIDVLNKWLAEGESNASSDDGD